MKRLFNIFLIAAMFAVSVTTIGVPASTAHAATAWETVGAAGFSGGEANDISLAFDNGTPYVAYQDGANSYKATLMKFDGVDWVTVGSAGFSAGEARYLSLAFDNGTPYVAYQDGTNSYKATVMKFDGADWVTVGVAGFSTGAALETSLAFDNGTPYVAYGDVALGYKAVVMKFNGAGWVTVGAAGFSLGKAFYTSLAFSGGTPYVAYWDGGNGDKVTVMKFDGADWVMVGAAGFSGGEANDISLAFDNGTPYVAYQDGTNSYKAALMKFDGVDWVTVGSAGFSAGEARYLSLAFDNGTPYVAYQDGTNSYKATVMKFDGADWVSVGAAGFSAADVYFTSLVFDNGTAYVSYQDGGNDYKAVVMKFQTNTQAGPNFHVNSNLDTDDGYCDVQNMGVGNHDCTLREAINAANASSDASIITFADHWNFTLGSALPDITTPMTINSTGQHILIDGVDQYQLFHVTSTGNLIIEGLILQHGNAASTGGAVYNEGGVLSINYSTISNNSANSGGGIYNDSGATLMITNSTLSSNVATVGAGGGVRNEGTLTVTNSTFSDNTAGASGGGIRNIGALTVTNSTFSSNSAGGSGGGIYNVSGFISITITNSTFSGNSAGSQGGGIYFSGGTLSYANTIIADSITSGNPGGDCDGSGIIGTNTNNLVENGGCSASLSGDPALDVLANNGGPTQTMALILGSSAIDAGDDSVCAALPVNNLDQRGFTRNALDPCDIGSYEYQTVPSVDSFTTPSVQQGAQVPITTFTASDDVAVTGYLVTESATPPLPNGGGWTASVPSQYTIAKQGGYFTEGTYTLYPWVKDVDGNVSAVYSSPANVDVTFISPYIMDITRKTPTNEITNADSLVLNVYFYGQVKNVDPSDFVVTGGTTGTVTGVSLGSVSADVTISGGDLASFNGTVGVDISPTQDIVSSTTGKHLVASIPNPNEHYTVSNVEQIINGGFNTYPAGKKIPTSWKAVKFSTTDGKNTAKQEGTASVKITGTGASKTLSQTLTLSGSSGDGFTFSFWVKGKSIPTAGVCRAEIMFYNGATLNPVKPTINCAKGTYGFNQKILAFTAPGNYTKVVIKFTYGKASGQVWFDAVSLIK